MRKLLATMIVLALLAPAPAFLSGCVSGPLIRIKTPPPPSSSDDQSGEKQNLDAH